MKRLFTKMTTTPIGKWITSTTIRDLSMFLLVVVAFGTASYLVFGSDTTIIAWLLILTAWLYLRQKQDAFTWQRFDDIDQRDIDYKDDVDRRIEQLLAQPRFTPPKIQDLSDRITINDGMDD